MKLIKATLLIALLALTGLVLSTSTPANANATSSAAKSSMSKGYCYKAKVKLSYVSKVRAKAQRIENLSYVRYGKVSSVYGPDSRFSKRAYKTYVKNSHKTNSLENLAHYIKSSLRDNC